MNLEPGTQREGMSGTTHWKSAEDPRTGRTYYYHEITRETQWRKPTELASDEEKRAMEEKERKQMDFFASMEANILNSLSQGQIPGTYNPKEFERRKSSRKVAERPELVRTISTMDALVLKDLIQRQPSFRNISRNPSLNPSEFTRQLRTSHIDANGFESFVSIMSDIDQLHPLDESRACDDDSMPALFSYIPNEDELDASELSMGDVTGTANGGPMDESSMSDFGLTWEETQALRKLASITKEMIDVEEEERETLPAKSKNIGQTANLISKDTKPMRDLPREIELDDSSEDEEEDTSVRKFQKPSAAFQKAKDIGGRELDFDDSDEDDSVTEAGVAPTPMKPRKSSLETKEKTVKAKKPSEQRPDIKRRNTCGTLYVGTTMSAPDKDANIKCVCGVLRTHILSSEQLPDDAGADEYRVFNDREADQSDGRRNHSNTRTPVPSLGEVTTFYRDIFYKAQMESDCIIMSLIYVERLIKKTGGKLRPRRSNWRTLVFSCMILSSKVWDDLSMWNVDFSQSCPPGVTFSLQRINELELAVLNALSFQVKVPASEYAKYYFLLRSMLIKSGLGGDNVMALDPLDVMAARQLQQVSSQFENLKLGRPGGDAKRSQSVKFSNVNKVSGRTKLGLEHVVKM